MKLEKMKGVFLLLCFMLKNITCDFLILYIYIYIYILKIVIFFYNFNYIN